MLVRRVAAALALAAFAVATASAPACSSPDPTTGSSSSTTGAGAAGGGVTTTPPGTGAGGNTGTAGAGGSISTSSAGGGGSGGASCGLCSAAFDEADPAPPASLCTDNGPPHASSKDYYDAWVSCCEDNGCPCNCNQPTGNHSGLCSTCLGAHCQDARGACGLCASCAQFVQSSGGTDLLCTAGSSPTSAALYADYAACACTSCPGECADNACTNLPASDDCLECTQSVCATKLDACLADVEPHSG